MNKYPVSYVQIHICELLEELPFQITRYGKVIAVVNRFNADSFTVKLPENKTPKAFTIGNEVNLGITPRQPCKHGFQLGLCKFGCK